MKMESPEAWRLLWMVASGVFLVAEMARRLRLWFFPFAIGAAAAAGAAWLGLPVPLEWALFALISTVTMVGLRPLARRLATGSSLAKVGSSRWIGRQAQVEVAIPAVGEGWVRLGRERWRAASGIGLALGAIPAGSTVLVTGVSGTQLIVLPLDVSEMYQTTSGQTPDQGA